MASARSLVSSSVRSAAAPCAPATRSLGSRGLRTRALDATKEGSGMRRIERMPFQTYQLALDVIRKDRQEKLEAIGLEKARIANQLKKPGITEDDLRVRSMKKHLEWLKIQADMNSPRIKYNFDRGIYGMDRPVYRFLLDRKWREYRRPILMQRLTQMNVIPDVMPHIDPVVDVQVRFKGRDIQPGAFVDSLVSENRPTFKVIPFEQGEMLCTVAVVDADVPDMEKDSFDYRLHWLVSNISISPTQTQAIGTGAKPSETVVEYLPPHVQKGSPYHRYAMFVFRQPAKLDVEGLRGQIKRDGFKLRSLSGKHQLEPIGAFMWRGQWDENTREVMQRHGLEGWDKMLVRAKA